MRSQTNTKQRIASTAQNAVYGCGSHTWIATPQTTKNATAHVCRQKSLLTLTRG